MNNSDLRARLQSGESISILGLGDSLTFGWEVKSGFFDRFVRATEERSVPGSIRSLNAGIPGDTAQGGLRRLPSLLSRPFDLAVVQFGLNDAFMGVSIDTFSGCLTKIGRRLTEAGCVVVLATSCPVASRADMAMIDRYYTAIGEVARSEGLALAKLHRYWLDHAQGTTAELMGYDGVHPTDAGHALMGEGLMAAVWDG